MIPCRPSAARTCVIFNPTARGERARRLRARLETLKGACVLKPTASAGAARALASEAVREGSEMIIAAGGDGTVNEVLNGIADEPDGLSRVRLGVLPTGTVNVFARELGIPANPRRAWEVLNRGCERMIDLPSIEFQAEGRLQGRCFAQMAGCGLDARAVQLVSWELKKKIGQFAYVVAGMRALREVQPPVQVLANSRSAAGRLVLVGNGRLYGGPLALFEQADLRDGLLDVCLFPAITWFTVLRYACAYVTGHILGRGREIHLQTPSLRLESSEPAPVQLDGEYVGCLPATCSVRTRALRVVVAA